ncbi:STAS domain-containing protein [Azonexus sp.]|uniref:STAS domain-containing protein n=1 Tax=Azonexus sp. TaxID=1872668 RepID=UPI0039E2EA2A
MKLPVSEQKGARVAQVTGRIDHALTEEFTQALKPLLDSCTAGQSALVLDFSGVVYISSAGLRVLMLAARQAKAQRGHFALAALTPLVQEVFTISRFNLIVPCYATVEAACEVLGT